MRVVATHQSAMPREIDGLITRVSEEISQSSLNLGILQSVRWKTS